MDMTQFWASFWPIFWSVIGTGLTALMSWGVSRLIVWLNGKIKDEKMRRHAQAIIEIVYNAVQAVFQTFVEALKDDGKFTEEEQKIAKQKCMDIILGQLTPELKAYIEENFGDLTAYLSNQIEAVIYQLKQ